MAAGFSRKVIYLHASNNNRANTMLQLFLGATEEHGCMAFMTGLQELDRTKVGKIARAMLTVRGTGRSSHIAGASVHNQRIERLWRDTFRCACHCFYALFYDMEDSGILSATNEVQLFCLHYVFLPRLNRQLEQFCHAWNDHHLRSEHGLTPNQLWLRGMCDCTFDYEIQPDFVVQSGQRNPKSQELQSISQTHNFSHFKVGLTPFITPEYNGLICSLMYTIS